MKFTVVLLAFCMFAATSYAFDVNVLAPPKAVMNIFDDLLAAIMEATQPLRDLVDQVTSAISKKMMEGVLTAFCNSYVAPKFTNVPNAAALCVTAGLSEVGKP
jgi:hypothetical protein